MTYHQFLNYVKEQSVYQFDHPEDHQATINHVIKNNSVELDGICLHKKGEILSPTVYLNDFYEEYLSGRSLPSILNEIVSTLDEEAPPLHIPADLFDDYESVKPNIILRIINYEKNRKVLKNCPYLPFCDLAITFRWLVHHDDAGIASALITNREFKKWGIRLEELYEIAIVNTMQLFPSRIRPIRNVLNDYIHDQEFLTELYSYAQSDIDIYVLTNQNHINGSTAMIYNQILSDFSARMKDDLYLLPSSIHEILLLPSHYCTNEEELLELVHDANRTVVNEQDFLSDSIYRYDRHENRVIMIKQ